MMVDRVTVSGVALVLSWGSLVAPPEARAQADNGYTNLQVLPFDIGRDELGEIMLVNMSGLGLPRRAGEGCLHCHVGSLDVPRGEWDYASDAKPAKAQARLMMAMVHEINDGYLARLSGRRDVVVGCETCHAGRLNPMPLVDLLLTEYASGGVESLVETYRSTRARYYEADAYDFRVGTLVEVANQLVDLDRADDAATVHELNIEYDDSPAAHAGLMRLRLYQALETGGPEAMIARYERLRTEHPPEAFEAPMIDVLAWQLYRADRPDPAMRLFELNFAEHPEAFAANESMAYAAFDTGDHERGLEIARRWVESHPDDRAGAQLLTELERRMGGFGLRS